MPIHSTTNIALGTLGLVPCFAPTYTARVWLSCVFLGLVVLVYRICSSRRHPDFYQFLDQAKRTNDFPGYETAPHISERVWDAIGAALYEEESSTAATTVIPSTCAITVRVRITNYEKLRRTSLEFREESEWDLGHSAMVLLKRFNGSHAYVHNGEIVMLIPRTKALTHVYGGHRETLVTNVMAALGENLLESASCATFTCKVGVWPTEAKAFQLILHRSYVALRKGVNRRLGSRLARQLIGLEQLQWCHDHNVFPVSHEAYGSLITMVKLDREVTNRDTSEKLTVKRRSYNISCNNLLNHYREYIEV